MNIMNPLNEKEFNKLDLDELANRIDDFFILDYQERYSRPFISYNNVCCISILKSRKFELLNDSEKKNALLPYYRSIFELSISNQYAGLENYHIHNPNLPSNKWEKPYIQIKYASFRQSMLLSSRIIFECIMEFIYFIEEKRLIPSNKSKIGTFRKWCSNKKQREYGWMVFYLVVIYKFDRFLRSPEVHGTSGIAIDALLCKVWPNTDQELDGVNIASSIWSSLMDTLNHKRVSSCSYSMRDEKLFSKFNEWDSVNLLELWNNAV